MLWKLVLHGKTSNYISVALFEINSKLFHKLAIIHVFSLNMDFMHEILKPDINNRFLNKY